VTEMCRYGALSYREQPFGAVGRNSSATVDGFQLGSLLICQALLKIAPNSILPHGCESLYLRGVKSRNAGDVFYRVNGSFACP
jgi:hypothetical protein